MSERKVAFIVAGSVWLQGLLLIWMADSSLKAAVQILILAGALTAMVYEAWIHRFRMNHRVDMVLVMAGLGGLGMLIGWAIELYMAGSLGSGMMAPGAPPSFWHRVFSLMTLGMLLGSVPASVFWTRCAILARGDLRRWISTHLIGNAAMIALMIGVARMIGPSISALCHSRIIGMHLGMMLGMLIGMEAGMFLGEAAFGLKPWKELASGPLESLKIGDLEKKA